MKYRMRVGGLLSTVALASVLLTSGIAVAADQIKIDIIEAGSPATPIGNTILANPATGIHELVTFSPDRWIGTAFIDDLSTYGRPVAAFYAQSTGDGTGSLNFELGDPPTDDVTLTIVGLIDDSSSTVPMEITINQTTVFTGDAMFEDWGGVEGQGNWTTVQLTISKDLFGPGLNTVTISNMTADGHVGEAPYILLGGALLDVPGTTVTVAQG